MAVMNQYSYQQQVIIDMSTTNKSFLDMHFYLKDRGIRNNNFFLALLDGDLLGVDPRDKTLSITMKQKVLRECIRNFWYFIRECVRIPDQGGQVGSGKRYQLHRGNLAMNFGFIHNWNMFVEFPRQNFKTISALGRYLWVFNFGTSNSEFMFINKKHEDSKMNLARFKELRAALPSYLQMDTAYSSFDGKKSKTPDTVETLQHPTNKNKIKTMPAARNKVLANSLGRGCTMPIQWYDEYAFIPHVGIIYLSATPAYMTAAINAKRNGAPYGILITTTPGDLTTDEGIDAFRTKDLATKFDETFYDMDPMQLAELIDMNEDSKFVYIRYTYQQLGRDEKWFRDMCIEMKKDWTAIRREVLLEWSRASDNSPFKKEDLIIVKGLLREPIRTITLQRYFQFQIYKDIDFRFPPIIGVDVSGGYRRDASAITIIDSRTTEVSATFNCNYINTEQLASVIYELVTKYMPNAIVNIERNGGFGGSVLSKLVNSSIKKNLYYEIKDRVIEESVVNGRVQKKSTKMKVFGLDSTKDVRELLMEILRDRMDHHKDKFISSKIFEELEGLEVKRSGKIEHSSNSHDDQVFSYLMALYVWYEGKNVMERYGLQKQSIRTDEELQDSMISIESRFQTNIIPDIEIMDNDEVKSQLDYLNSVKVTQYEDFVKKQYEEDRKAEEKLLNDPRYGKEMAKHMGLDYKEVVQNGSHVTTIPDDVFKDFYN